jgi:hypothetical protein
MPDNGNDSNLCNCGRDNDRRHCPNCGHINYYAFKKDINRPHPRSGVMTEATLFRCRSCNKNFDDLQWQFDCNAPRSKRIEQQQTKLATKETLLRLAETEGVKFTENDKRHFRKVVGMSYDEYVRNFRMASEQKKKRMEALAQRLTSVAPPPVMSNRKLTPLQWHIENCNYCNTHTENCEVAKQLEAAEKMEAK